MALWAWWSAQLLSYLTLVSFILICLNSQFFVHFLIVDDFSLNIIWIQSLIFRILPYCKLRLFLKLSEFFTLKLFVFLFIPWMIAFLKRSKERLLIWMVLVDFWSLYSLKHLVRVLWSVSSMASFLIGYQVFWMVLIRKWTIWLGNELALLRIRKAFICKWVINFTIIFYRWSLKIIRNWFLTFWAEIFGVRIGIGEKNALVREG